MITFILLLVLLIVITLIAVCTIGVGAIGFILTFGDIALCIYIVVRIIMHFIKKHKKG